MLKSRPVGEMDTTEPRKPKRTKEPDGTEPPRKDQSVWLCHRDSNPILASPADSRIHLFSSGFPNHPAKKEVVRSQNYIATCYDESRTSRKRAHVQPPKLRVLFKYSCYFGPRDKPLFGSCMWVGLKTRGPSKWLVSVCRPLRNQTKKYYQKSHSHAHLAALYQKEPKGRRGKNRHSHAPIFLQARARAPSASLEGEAAGPLAGHAQVPLLRGDVRLQVDDLEPPRSPRLARQAETRLRATRRASSRREGQVSEM